MTLGTLVKTGGDQDALLEAGETWVYTVNQTVAAGDVGDSYVNTATVNATDDEAQPATDTDTASVSYTNAGPAITLVKTVDANGDGTFADSESVQEGGVGDQVVTYRYALTNTGAAASVDPLSITSLLDDKAGDVLAKGTLVKTGGDQDALLEAGETWVYTLDHTVAAGDVAIATTGKQKQYSHHY